MSEGPWFANGLRFGCTQCGRCCGGAPGYVWVDDGDVIRMATELGLTPEEFERKHVRQEGGRRSLLELENGDCEFLRLDADGRKRCSIYMARPVQCRTWPFWQSNLKNPRAWERAGQTCPGIDHGEHHPLPIIQAALLRNREAQLPL